MAGKRVYKVVFFSQGTIFEVFAEQVSQGGLYGFIEVEGLLFGERAGLLVDPSEERLKTEFEGVKRTYIPMHAVVRIDEVEKEGPAKIIPVAGKGDNVTPFPVPFYTPGGDAGKS